MATPLQPSPALTVTSAPPRRRLRNFLLEPRFQLKFTAYIVAVSLLMASLLGTFLWQNTQALLSETEQAVEARSQAAISSRELSQAMLTNQLVEQMDDPAFAAQLEAESARIDAEYEREHQAVLTQRADLVRRQQLGWVALAGALLAFIVGCALATIVVTHKVVGPLLRIGRLVNDVGAGRYLLPTHALRDGDELKSLFTDVANMVQSLRDAQTEDLSQIQRVMRRAQQVGAPQEVLSELEMMGDRIRARLGEQRR